MPVTWLKWKYRRRKTPGTNKSRHDMQGRKKRTKAGKAQVVHRQKVLVLAADQKLRWEWR